MLTQTSSRPMNIPTLIKQIKDSEPIKTSESRTIFPYLELYNNPASPRTYRFLSVLHRNLKKYSKDHFHSSTYKYCQDLSFKRKSLAEVAKSELEGRYFNSDHSKRKILKDGRMNFKHADDFLDLKIQANLRGREKNGLPRKLPNLSKSVDISKNDVMFYKEVNKGTEDGLTKDASCNT